MKGQKSIKELVWEIVDNTYESIVKNDIEFIKTEEDKKEIIQKLYLKLTKEDKKLLDLLIKAFEKQIFITAMGFSFVRVLDISKLDEMSKKHGSN